MAPLPKQKRDIYKYCGGQDLSVDAENAKLAVLILVGPSQECAGWGLPAKKQWIFLELKASSASCPASAYTGNFRLKRRCSDCTYCRWSRDA